MCLRDSSFISVNLMFNLHCHLLRYIVVQVSTTLSILYSCCICSCHLCPMQFFFLSYPVFPILILSSYSQIHFQIQITQERLGLIFFSLATLHLVLHVGLCASCVTMSLSYCLQVRDLTLSIYMLQVHLCLQNSKTLLCCGH